MTHIPIITQEASPTSGSSVDVNRGRSVTVYLTPAGTLATLTVNLPAVANNGDVIEIVSSEVVTALTVAAGASSVIGEVLSTLVANGRGRFRYIKNITSWLRIG